MVLFVYKYDIHKKMSMLISPGRVKENLLADFMRNISWKIQYFGSGSQIQAKVPFLTVGLMGS